MEARAGYGRSVRCGRSGAPALLLDCLSACIHKLYLRLVSPTVAQTTGFRGATSGRANSGLPRHHLQPTNILAEPRRKTTKLWHGADTWSIALVRKF